MYIVCLFLVFRIPGSAYTYIEYKTNEILPVSFCLAGDPFGGYRNCLRSACPAERPVRHLFSLTPVYYQRYRGSKTYHQLGHYILLLILWYMIGRTLTLIILSADI